MKLNIVSRFHGYRAGMIVLALGIAGASGSAAADVVEIEAMRSVPQNLNSEIDPAAEVAVPESAANDDSVDASASQPNDADEEASPRSPGEPRTLSVPPLDHATYPADRPEWVDATPELEADEVVWPMKSLLRGTPEQATESLRVQVGGAAAAYAEHVLGEDRAARLGDSPLVKISLDDIPADDWYMGTATLGDRQVYEQAVRLRFDESYRRQLAGAWQQEEVGHRLSFMGIAGTTGVCLLLTGTALIRRFARPAA